MLIFRAFCGIDERGTLFEGSMMGSDIRAGHRLLRAMAAMALALPGPAFAAREWNLQTPVTPVAR